MSNTCICVLNYNNAEGTMKCLHGIMQQSFRDFRTVIIDNCSTDDSVQLLQNYLTGEHIPFWLTCDDGQPSLPGKEPVIIIRAEKNGGYASGNNIGIRFAQKWNIFSHILILNNDAVLETDFLEKMDRYYQTEQRLHGPIKIALGAGEKDPSGKFRNRGFHYLNLPTGLVTTFPVFPSLRYIVGSCIYLPADAPLFDERYFLFYEDADYSLFLRKNGYRIASFPAASYIHDMGGTTRMTPRLHRTVFKSMKLFYIKHFPLLFPWVVILRFMMNLFLLRPRIAADLIRISTTTRHSVHP